MSGTIGRSRIAAGAVGWFVAGLAGVLVVAVVALRDPPGVSDAADQPGPTGDAATDESGEPSPTADERPTPNPPLTLDGWGPVRIGGPAAALAEVLCDGSPCPDPVVDVAVDTAAGCVQRVRPPATPEGVAVWIWEVAGRVEAVGVTGPPSAVQQTPLGPAFGAIVGDDGSGRPRGGPPGTARVQAIGDVRVTVASLSSEFVEYAEVATPLGAACEVDVPAVVVEPVRADEPVIVDGTVAGATLAASVSEIGAAGWRDVSFADDQCRTWLSSSGAGAYSRGGTVVGLSARAVAGGPAVGQPVEEVTTTIPFGRLAIAETVADPWRSPWQPTYGTVVMTGTAVGRLVLVTVRPAGVVEGVDWPVRTADPTSLVSAIVVGENCEDSVASVTSVATR